MPERKAVDMVEPELNQEILEQVIQMGVPETPAKHALYRTGNSSADAAVGWYFDNMDDIGLHLPLAVPKQEGPSGAEADNVPKEALDMMISMGFDEKRCREALKACDMNLSRATDWLFSHPQEPEDDDVSMAEANEEPPKDLDEMYKCTRPGLYQLQSFITHLGGSVDAGHYVCHIKKAINSGDPSKQWVYFNDAKVASTSDPPIGQGYMYFLNKINKDN